MAMANKVYPRTGDTQTIYLKKCYYKPEYRGRRLYDI